MCIRVAIIWWLLFLLLPGVTGRALAQGGRFTPQQEAWMRHIFLEWVTANSNAVASMYSRTNTWNGTATWVGSHSNAVQSMEGRTSTWNTASSWVGAHSNAVQYMEGQTNQWDQALTNVYSSGSNNWNFSKVGLRAWLEYSTNADTISGHPWADILALTNSGATTNWVDLYYYPRTNPSNWVDQTVTNGLWAYVDGTNRVDLYYYPRANPSNWVDQAVTNGLWAYVDGTNWVDFYYYPRTNPSNWVDQTVTNGLPYGDVWAASNTVFSGSNTFTGPLVVNGSALYPAAWGSGYMHVTTQAFTATAGYEVITGYTGAGSSGMGTLTPSNLTVISAGEYQLTACFAFDTSAANLDVHLHAYTNGVQAENLGTRTFFATAGVYGNMTVAGMVRMASNDYIDLRMDVDKDCTLIFEHGDATLKKIAP